IPMQQGQQQQIPMQQGQQQQLQTQQGQQRQVPTQQGQQRQVQHPMQPQQVQQLQGQQQHRTQSLPSNTLPPPNQQNVSGQAPYQQLNGNLVAPQRDMTVPIREPQYEAPPIPAAYTHVSGAFISPRDQQYQPRFPPSNNMGARPSMNPSDRQNLEPRLQS